MVYKTALILSLVAGLMLGAAPAAPQVAATPAPVVLTEPAPTAIPEPVPTEAVLPTGAGPTLSGAVWQERFLRAWDASHDTSFSFVEADALEDWKNAYNLAFGSINNALTAEAYQLFDNGENYFAELNLYMDEMPALQIDAYWQYFYDAAGAALLSHNENATVREIRETKDAISGMVGDFALDRTNDESDWTTVGEVTIECRYTAQTNAVTCLLSFYVPTEDVIESTGEAATATKTTNVDGVRYIDAFAGYIQENTDATIDFPLYDFMESALYGGSYGSIALGEIAGFIELDLYQSYENQAEYWLSIDMDAEDIPALEIDRYEAYFYAAVQAAVLAHDAQIDEDTLQAIDAHVRGQIEAAKTGATPPDESHFFGKIYVSPSYYADYAAYSCTLCFEF